uniref:Carboxylic ester hydrolase n=1 Tax=Caenorhabditis tropicalis TaxID=1561998 RepID=A0A1I7TFI3_9PELO
MGGHLSHLNREKNEEVLNGTFGPIRGNVYRHGDKIVDGYLGIPFAKPPVNELRFKKPEPMEVWKETRDCTEYGPRCPQSGPFAEAIRFQKDDIPDESNCLTLNVFAPRWDSEEFKNERPVMVYVHGGGFECSSSRDYCDYSLSGTLPLKDVVVVTINYRIGILGFFSTGDDVCPGNLALWDLTLGLKWIRKHIISFGGDPNNVTILGQSAGAALVDILSLSPHSRDLFQRVIPISGGSLCEYAVRTLESQGNVCKEFARHLGYTGNDSENLLEWMKDKPIEEIQNMNGFIVPASGILAYTPNLDGDFIPKPLDKLRKEASKKSIMLGFSEHEGLFFEFLTRDPTPPLKALRNYISVYYKEDTGPDFENVREKIFRLYTRGIDTSDEKKVKERVIDFVGDALFTAGVFANAQSCLKHGNQVWLYIFDYCEPNGFGSQKEFMTFVAPTHCTDLRYILGEGLYSEFNSTDEELRMIDKMTTMYSNFAKYGNPNENGSVEWEPYSSNQPRKHYRISYPNGSMREDYHADRMEFLENIRKNNKNLETVVYGK